MTQLSARGPWDTFRAFSDTSGQARGLQSFKNDGPGADPGGPGLDPGGPGGTRADPGRPGWTRADPGGPGRTRGRVGHFKKSL